MDLPRRTVLTVTELTQEIKDLLEGQFPDLWVEGEISNLRIPPSGHIYFTLKDDSSQIRAVLFRAQARTLRFKPEDGIQVVESTTTSRSGGFTMALPRGRYTVLVQTDDGNHGSKSVEAVVEDGMKWLPVELPRLYYPLAGR